MKYVFDTLTSVIMGSGYLTWRGLYMRLDKLNAEAGYRRYNWVS